MRSYVKLEKHGGWSADVRAIMQSDEMRRQYEALRRLVRDGHVGHRDVWGRVDEQDREWMEAK